jgi:hypothetical protein
LQFFFLLRIPKEAKKLKHFIKNQKAMTNQVIALVLTVALIFGGVAVYAIYTMSPSSPDNTGTTDNTGTGNNGLTIANYGAHTMSVGGYSGLPGVTTSYSQASDFVVQWVSPSTGRILNPSDSNGTGSIDVPPGDNGIVWAVVEPSTGYYTDPDSIVTKNAPYVTQAMYGPAFGSGVNYWYFPYSVNEAVPTYNSAPTYSFSSYFKPYGAITLSSPSDISSIGTSSVDKYIGWTASFASLNQAFAVTKLVLTVNTTASTNKIQFGDFAVPWSNTVVSGATAAPSQETLGSTDYTYMISGSLNGAKFVQHTANTENSLSFKTHVTCNLASGDVITAQLTIYGLGTDGKTVVTTTDTVNLSA